MAAILDKAGKNGAQISNFEVLLDAASINNSDSGETAVLATRFYPVTNP
jgi:hypothetical protein